MLDRQVAPPVQPLASVTLPAADVFSLPNGARLHVLHNDAQPIIRLEIAFRAGKWYDPAPGVSLLTARMLLEGTRTRTARQIADEVAFYGASLECEQGFDRATLTLYCLSRHLEKLLPLVAEVIIAPTFPAVELELLKTRTIQNVRVERQKTSYLASERFAQNLYGPEHPYGIAFNESSFRQTTREAIAAFHESHYQLATSEVFLCGNVSSSHQNLIQEVLGSINSEPSAETTPALLFPQSAPPAHVNVPDSSQSSLRIGRVWPSLHHPDTHHLQVLIKVLGGYFGSRLMKNIREDKGFTYGIYASISPRENASHLVIGTDVNAISTEAAIAEIKRELVRLQEEIIPAEELQTVKNYMAGKFANELGTVFEQCDKYKNLIFLKLPHTYYTDFLAQISKVDSSTLLHLAQQYLLPEKMIEVAAGPTAMLQLK
ncbi:Predicted Zn-dependent peptidase [Hymenobacter daecheongensis DSM 21074]|uniref:Predicted Zn-dependent peptidase n=1 Tax=Hymenobacter daecheongensis DSM 21074 TaxID=1121955 RepID=A0A1M6MME6_9BACT|nr:pitrilysin family protein [Hymenobacter daecheongensis]SHJ84619.1 Predicted Zn-dependent peptidase [Hymenobacter daecheongensis DSM 21074]